MTSIEIDFTISTPMTFKLFLSNQYEVKSMSKQISIHVRLTCPLPAARRKKTLQAPQVIAPKLEYKADAPQI